MNRVDKDDCIGNALLNLKKGDSALIGIPHDAHFNSISLKERQHPLTWLLMQVDIIKVKVKSESKEKKVKEKIEKVVLPTVSAVNQYEALDKSDTNDVAARMAKLAQQAGGSKINQLADIMKATHQSNNQSTHQAQENRFAHSPKHERDLEHYNPDPPITSSPSTALAVTEPVSDIIAANVNNNADYLPMSAQIDQNHPSSDTPVISTLEGTNTSIIRPEAVYNSQANATTDSSSMIQQSLLVLQQSIMHMQTKLDQVGMQVSGTHSLLLQNKTQKNVNLSQEPFDADVKSDLIVDSIREMQHQYNIIKQQTLDENNAQINKELEFTRTIADLRVQLKTSLDSCKVLESEKSALLEENEALKQDNRNLHQQTLQLETPKQPAVDYDNPEVDAYIKSKIEEVSSEFKLKQISLEEKLTEALDSVAFERNRCLELQSELDRLRSTTTPTPSEDIDELHKRIKDLEESLGKINEIPAATTNVLDDFKSCLQDMYNEVCESFLTDEDLEQLEDEKSKEIAKQFTKVHIKRLRDILRQTIATRIPTVSKY